MDDRAPSEASDDGPRLLPDLVNNRGDARAAGEGGNLSVDGGHGVAGEGALPVALAEEEGEDNGAQEGVLEGECAQDDSDKDEDLGEGDDGHGPVIVCLDPGLELLGKRRGSGGTSGSCRRARRQKLGHQSRARKREGVEQRKYGVGHEGDRNRLGSPPEQGEQEILDILIDKALFDVCSVGLGSSEGFVANDGVAEKGAGKCSLMPPNGGAAEGDEGQENPGGGEEEGKVTASPNVVLSCRHWSSEVDIAR